MDTWLPNIFNLDSWLILGQMGMKKMATVQVANGGLCRHPNTDNI